MKNRIVRKFVCKKSYPGFPENLIVSNADTASKEMFSPVNGENFSLTDTGHASKGIVLEILISSTEFWAELAPNRLVELLLGKKFKFEVLEYNNTTIDIKFGLADKDDKFIQDATRLYSQRLLNKKVATWEIINGVINSFDGVNFIGISDTPVKLPLMVDKVCDELICDFLAWRAEVYLGDNEAIARRCEFNKGYEQEEKAHK